MAQQKVNLFSPKAKGKGRAKKKKNRHKSVKEYSKQGR